MSERIRGRAECASDICEGDNLSKQGVRDTGTLNPDTPDPTKNTPGAESKN